jgi:hypothetical protein
MTKTPTIAEQMSYAAWRFHIYVSLSDVHYDLIDTAVRAGHIKPGCTADEARAALRVLAGEE